MRKLFLVMVFLGKGRQMESTDRTDRAEDQRHGSTDLPEETRWESSDIDCDVSMALRSRRWEQREGPFQGFGSPEGKF
jgi:hypothetical protein